MKHKTVQDLVDDCVSLEKRANQIELSELLLHITENNCLTDEDKVGHIRFIAEKYKKGEM